MIVDIFYKSYKADYKWLYASLESVKKYLTGYNHIHVVIPKHERRYIKIPEGIQNLTIYDVSEYGNTYLYQQVVKMQASLYTGADYILYMDSDCIAELPTDINDYIIDGKPVIYYTPYDKVGDAICWKEPTERFIGHPVEYEFMRRLPLIYHRSTIEAVRKLKPDLEYYIMSQQSFSEFNAIGAWAFENHRSLYRFLNTDESELERPIAKQWHSYTQWEQFKQQQNENN